MSVTWPVFRMVHLHTEWCAKTMRDRFSVLKNGITHQVSYSWTRSSSIPGNRYPQRYIGALRQAGRQAVRPEIPFYIVIGDLKVAIMLGGRETY